MFWWVVSLDSVEQSVEWDNADCPQGVAGTLGRERSCIKNLPALSDVLSFTFASDPMRREAQRG